MSQLSKVIEDIEALPENEKILWDYSGRYAPGYDVTTADLKALVSRYRELLEAGKHLVYDVGDNMLAADPSAWVAQDKAIDRLRAAIVRAEGDVGLSPDPEASVISRTFLD